MTEEQKLLTDAELDRLLAQATKPEIPPLLEQNLRAKVFAAKNENSAARPQSQRASRWLVGLPLAASLAFGVWLGASGAASGGLTETAAEVASTDIGNATGFDDLVSIIEGEKS